MERSNELELGGGYGETHFSPGLHNILRLDEDQLLLAYLLEDASKLQGVKGVTWWLLTFVDVLE